VRIVALPRVAPMTWFESKVSMPFTGFPLVLFSADFSKP